MYGFFFVYKRRHNKRTYLPSPQSRIYLSPHLLYAYCQNEHLSMPEYFFTFVFSFHLLRFLHFAWQHTTHKKKQDHGANKQWNKPHFLCTTQKQNLYLWCLLTQSHVLKQTIYSGFSGRNTQDNNNTKTSCFLSNTPRLYLKWYNTLSKQETKPQTK